MKECFQRGLLIWWSVAAFTASAQDRPRVELAADLLALFEPDRAHETLSCEVRRPASASGVSQPALFEHPLAVGRPARVDYDLTLPPASAAEPLLLAFDIALSDGIKPGKTEDGVRFIVTADGREVFARETIETRWQPQGVDLTEFAARRVR